MGKNQAVKKMWGMTVLLVLFIKPGPKPREVNGKTATDFDGLWITPEEMGLSNVPRQLLGGAGHPTHPPQRNTYFVPLCKMLTIARSSNILSAQETAWRRFQRVSSFPVFYCLYHSHSRHPINCGGLLLF